MTLCPALWARVWTLCPTLPNLRQGRGVWAQPLCNLLLLSCACICDLSVVVTTQLFARPGNCARGAGCCTLPRCVVAVCGQVLRRSFFCPGFGREAQRGHLCFVRKRTAKRSDWPCACLRSRSSVPPVGNSYLPPQRGFGCVFRSAFRCSCGNFTCAPFCGPQLARPVPLAGWRPPAYLHPLGG